MREFPTTPVEMFACLWRNRELIRASTKREISSRYKGSILGMLWSFIMPLMMLTVYTFVFSVVFGARWDGGVGGKIEFAMLLFAGLVVFNIYAECINKAPTLIISNTNYVKKVVFPLEILPLITLLAALYHALVSFVVWMVAYIVLVGIPPVTVLYIPLVIFPFCLFTMGLSWALASLGVFVRDVSQLVGVTTTVLLFMSAIFYPVNALPSEYQQFLYFNPLVPVIEMVRDVLYWGKVPNLHVLACYWLATLVTAWLGFAWFQKTRKGFSDVL